MQLLIGHAVNIRYLEHPLGIQTIDWFQSCDTCMYHISLCRQLQNKEQLSDQVTLLFIAQYVLTLGLVASISKFKIPQGKKQ